MSAFVSYIPYEADIAEPSFTKFYCKTHTVCQNHQLLYFHLIKTQHFKQRYKTNVLKNYWKKKVIRLAVQSPTSVVSSTSVAKNGIKQIGLKSRACDEKLYKTTTFILLGLTDDPLLQIRQKAGIHDEKPHNNNIHPAGTDR
ncbi:hypothetical protein HPG69_018942 [Diceros bicornis minor]|uniref:Uncharacterized protein n=1 Tax=Diceros bicornis minor TaxID=77932 RepID=A0A7J7F9X6_DICBM|nr:hypothetical protein HPG69_018942 [Diceros bicornis minor]